MTKPGFPLRSSKTNPWFSPRDCSWAGPYLVLLPKALGLYRRLIISHSIRRIMADGNVRAPDDEAAEPQSQSCSTKDFSCMWPPLCQSCWTCWPHLCCFLINDPGEMGHLPGIWKAHELRVPSSASTETQNHGQLDETKAYHVYHSRWDPDRQSRSV